MTNATLARDRLLPLALGLGTLVIAIAAVEGLIRAGLINGYIVPLPSDVALSFGKVITEEDIAGRFVATFTEAFIAGAMIMVVGVLLGLLLYRFYLLRRATETWIAALAAAPTVLLYP